jgi:hypothetical protein
MRGNFLQEALEKFETWIPKKKVYVLSKKSELFGAAVFCLFFKPYLTLPLVSYHENTMRLSATNCEV